MLKPISGAAFVLFVLLALAPIAQGQKSRADLPNPILFVTQLPLPYDWMMITQTFGNHLGNVPNAGRGGDLYIYYPAQDSLKNLTTLAGYGNEGFQGAGSIAVRDPQVHWSGEKAVFSMAIGATETQYQHVTYYWQLYEITGLGINETPVITKVPNQPADYNNISPIYGTDDRILFTSDRPRNGQRHLYPQRDEYESAPTVTGVWSLDPASGDLFLMNHAPSGSFSPFIDSFGRVISTRWDHLQQDQQNYPGSSFNPFNWTDESLSSTRTNSAAEVFPEPRTQVDQVNAYTIEVFFPWMMHEDGTGEEVLNHLGRHEMLSYFEQSFLDDPSLSAFYEEPRQSMPVENLFQIAENPTNPGEYVAINTPTFYHYTAGQIVKFYAPPSMNPDSVVFSAGTAGEFADGHYRHPRPLSDGSLVASHTSYTGPSANLGTREAPESPHRYRIKILDPSGNQWTPGETLTDGIYKPVSFWDPDFMITYSAEIPMWEFSPVEVVARPRPARTTTAIEAPEMQIFQEESIDVEALKAYLKQNELALMISRNVTKRDAADKQQPFNLRVSGTSMETSGDAGKMYDVSHLQLFQGDQIRGYDTNDAAGRRILAQPMHDASGNPETTGPPGSVQIASDGSIAAFVPARRAMTWQLVNAEEVPVVRERYWLSFQPGEIRTCGGCHGANTYAQDGSTSPVNPPEALRNLMRHYRQVPTDSEKPFTSISEAGIQGNYPNPFNPETVIRYRISEAGPVTLRIFTVTGREIAQLVDGYQSPGEYTVRWKAESQSSGVYMYQLQANGQSWTQKMILAK